MVGIDLTLASYKLNIIALVKPVRQKIRRFHLGSSSDNLDKGRQSSESRFYQRGKVS